MNIKVRHLQYAFSKSWPIPTLMLISTLLIGLISSQIDSTGVQILLGGCLLGFLVLFCYRLVQTQKNPHR